MSFDKKEELLDYEMIYRQDDNEQKFSCEIKEENNEFKMIYKPNENKTEKMKKLEYFKEYNIFHFEDDKEYSGDILRILDKYFIKQNKNKCKLIYNNKKYKLKEYFEEIDNNYKDKDIIKLKLYGINNISDMSRMFYGCYHLSSFSEYPTQQNINDLNDNFFEDKSYTSLREEIKSNNSRLKEDNDSGLIGELNKENILSLNSLSSIHNNNATNIVSIINTFQNNIDIPLLNKNKIFKMEKMFFGCISLVSLPDISNWNTNNLAKMSCMFSWCTSLKSLPDISNWNTNNVIYMCDVFYGCKSLKIVGNKNFSDFEFEWNMKLTRK